MKKQTPKNHSIIASSISSVSFSFQAR